MNDYLKLEGVHKRFGGTAVLDRVDLEIRQGELVTLLGPSGCGKSTLLRCIAGLTGLDGGRIVLEHNDLAKLPPRSREVGMVFQSYALFPNLTVGQNVEYGMKMRGMPQAVRRSRTEELLALVDLEAKVNAYPHALSGGQQQRVALARSLAVEPKVLLLDEPLSALDARIRKNLRTEIRNIQKRLNMTTLFVTHDQEEALILSDRVCLMNEGRIVQDGSPETLYTAPRTEFAARFMGSYNVLTRREAELLFPGLPSASGSYAIRPEALLLLRTDDAHTREAGARLIPGATVQVISVLGNIIRCTVEVSGIQLTVDALNDGTGLRFREGEQVTLALDSGKLLHLE